MNVAILHNACLLKCLNEFLCIVRNSFKSKVVGKNSLEKDIDKERTLIVGSIAFGISSTRTNESAFLQFFFLKCLNEPLCIVRKIKIGELHVQIDLFNSFLVNYVSRKWVSCILSKESL